jgi:vacuolar-type H+-ATPase subunit E/Vma4
VRPSARNPEEILPEEILAEARRESEETIRRAQQEAKTFLAKAVAEADRMGQERLNLARAESSRRKELILATVPVEVGRIRSARIEALLESILEDVRRRLMACDGFDYRKTVIVLAADAIGRMAGDAFVIKLSAADRAALGKGLAEDITGRVGRSPLTITISDEPMITENGLIVQDIEGRQWWDNRLSARLERLWPELRRQIAVGTLLDAGSGSGGGGA